MAARKASQEAETESLHEDEATSAEANELENIEVTEEDIAENEAMSASDEEDSTSEAPAEEEKGENPDESVLENENELSVTYKGVKDGSQPLASIQVIVPLDGTAATDSASIDYGDFFQLSLGESRVVTEEQRAWLAAHPLYDIS